MNQFDQPRLIAGLVGVAAHQVVFRHGEWNAESHIILSGHALALLAGLATAAFRGSSYAEVFQVAGCYFAGLYMSMLTYRAFFHRLSRFPGAFGARLSKLWMVRRSLRKLHMFKEIQDLHAQYGDYVRVGPSELSIADPDAVEAIYGTKSPVTKGSYYAIFEPLVSLQSTRDKADHSRRRKVWDQGFSIKALSGYNGRVTSAIAELLQVIDRDHKKPINVTEWFSYMTFDIMEDLTFNRKSGLLRNSGEAYIFKTIRGFTGGLALCYHIPWMSALLRKTPILNKDLHVFQKWMSDRIEERAKNEPAEPDIFSWVLDAYMKGPKTPTDTLHLIGDGQLSVVAGSDTVAQPLIWLFFELAHHPDRVRRLREELATLPSLSPDNLQNAEYLDALVNETLRLHPPIISGTQRLTPPEGLAIGDHHIPGNTIVMVPTYTVCRDERCFVQPNEFIPERWTTRPELVKNKSVFIPFNSGQYTCVGKRLAMIELRQATAEILTRYDIAHVPEHNKEAFLEGKQDVFVLSCGPLPLKFTPL